MKGGPKILPHHCPSCGLSLKVTSLACESCETIISGSFELPLLAKLSGDDLRFVIDFVKCSGSLKIMAQQMGLSYPTVRNRLDEIISIIKTKE
jgi:hypothetical protein